MIGFNKIKLKYAEIRTLKYNFYNSLNCKITNGS